MLGQCHLFGRGHLFARTACAVRPACCLCLGVIAAVPHAFAHRPGTVLCTCIRDVVAGALPVSRGPVSCRLITVSRACPAVGLARARLAYPDPFGVRTGRRL